MAATAAALVASETPEVLGLDDVWQKLGSNQILEGVSFRVFDRVRPGVVTGQIVALLGPSGVGKTRLLRLIAGLDSPDRGTISGVAGKPLAAGATGVVFQNYPLLRHRTVLGNLMLAAEMNGMSSELAKRRALELLQRFDLAERASFYPAQLSGGQRQRIAIAQQVVCQKQLLLMDEPFSGLDPAALEKVIRLIVEVANMDDLNTILLVTHDIRSALAVADTVFMLGRERKNADRVVGGAKIRHHYDLVAEGLAYRPQVEQEPRFSELERELKARFLEL